MCWLRSLTPHTPGEYNTPTGLFCVGYAPQPLTLLESTHTHRALLCQLRSLTPPTPGEFTTPTGLWLCSLTPHTPHHIHMFFFFVFFFVQSCLTPRTLKK